MNKWSDDDLRKVAADIENGRDNGSILPCDVMVAPNTIIRRGCRVSTLMLAISRRDGLPDDDRTRIKFRSK